MHLNKKVLIAIYCNLSTNSKQVWQTPFIYIANCFWKQLPNSFGMQLMVYFAVSQHFLRSAVVKDPRLPVCAKDHFTGLVQWNFLGKYSASRVFNYSLVIRTWLPSTEEMPRESVSGKSDNNMNSFERPIWHNYASPTSGDAYRNRRLTTNFKLWVEIFCVPTCFHMRIPKPCPSVCPSVRTPRKDIIIASSISVLH